MSEDEYEGEGRGEEDQRDTDGQGEEQTGYRPTAPNGMRESPGVASDGIAGARSVGSWGHGVSWGNVIGHSSACLHCESMQLGAPDERHTEGSTVAHLPRGHCI